MDAVDHILHHTVMGSNCSPEEVLEASFLSSCDDKMWPFADISPEAKTAYLRANMHTGKFGFCEEFDLETMFSIKDYSFRVIEKMSFDGDDLKMDIDCVIRQGNAPQTKDLFIYHLMQKHFRFLKDFTQKNGKFPKDSEITIHACSGVVNKISVRGGYVWATHGFSFASDEELMSARNRFKEFLQQKDVYITDRDLKRFKYPCHFAAFGIQTPEGFQELGKEFLLQHSWHGKISGADDEKSEPFRYQKAYHEKGKEEARLELSKGYSAIINKYSHQARANLFQKLMPKVLSLVKNRRGR